MAKKAKRSGPCKGKSLNKPFRTPGGPKKSAVCVKAGSKVKIVRFGDPKMKIKKVFQQEGSHLGQDTTVLIPVQRPRHVIGLVRRGNGKAMCKR